MLTFKNFVECLSVLINTDSTNFHFTHLQTIYAQAKQTCCPERGTEPHIFATMHVQNGQREFVLSELGKRSLDGMQKDEVDSIYRNYTDVMDSTIRNTSVHPVAAHWMASVLKHIESMRRAQGLNPLDGTQMISCARCSKPLPKFT